ncbi:thiamine-phosphate kinase [Bythopirellula polymerisocia]|uniref:Thiamine-monophosphate kinase n=1 Tax=Bythopirellula polymerisocia TaxID=2528003 RepID=A0A5C6CBQ3_9BACT|nr:thiamine-phosphate kinase [Bythopirellula polymerisocia]TWU20854.1 Thiamine-monophosphate kinase [Bythopirellula polymerisocia]
MSLESELIAWLKGNLPQAHQFEVGLGDDAAVLELDGRAVVTTDMLTDGVDFLLEEVEPQLIGHKALGVNLSDLAAMAAEPIAAFVSLALPRAGTENLSPLELAIELYQGMLPLAELHGVTIAGGDTNTWDGSLAISITAIGETTSRGPLRRSGARAGDKVLVTGHLGGSILGRHLQVEPRIREALQLHEQYKLHAGIDISDGLALDASRLATASDCGIVLEMESIPISGAAYDLSNTTGKTPLEHALGDGEDFELLLAVPPEEAKNLIAAQPIDVSITCIGEFIDSSGLWKEEIDGSLSPLTPTGYQHEADR